MKRRTFCKMGVAGLMVPASLMTPVRPASAGLFLTLSGADSRPTPDYWVATDGSSGNAGTYASPWSAESLKDKVFSAGDTIGFKNGTYTPYDAGAGGSVPVIYIKQSGTAGSPITLMAETRRQVILEGPGKTLATYDGQYAMLGVASGNLVNYVTWDGFVIHNCFGVGFAISAGRSSNLIVEHCHIYDIAQDSEPTGNTECLDINYADDMIVRNCKFEDAQNPSKSTNSGGIKVYHCKNLLVENCEFALDVMTGQFVGIYDKLGLGLGQGTGDSGNTYRYNYFHDLGTAFLIHANSGQPNNDSSFYQNLVKTTSVGTGIMVRVENLWMDSGKTFSAYNNTLIDPYTPRTAGHAQYLSVTMSESQTNGGVEFYNNICWRSGSISGEDILTAYGAPPTLISVCDYNDWATDLEITLGDNHASEESYAGLTNWQTNSHGFAAGSISSDPTFVATGSAPEYYKLDTGSPCINTGKTGGVSGGDNVNMGCYITGNEQIGKNW